MNPDIKKHIDNATTETVTADTIMRKLNISMAKLEVDIAEVTRLDSLANAAGKMTKIVSERGQNKKLFEST